MQALWLRNGDIRSDRSSVCEMLFSLFRNFKCQFQKQNEAKSKLNHDAHDVTWGILSP